MALIYQILESKAAERGLSRKKMCAALDISLDLYAQKRGGNSMLTVDQLYSVAKWLGYSMETVYDLERS